MAKRAQKPEDNIDELHERPKNSKRKQSLARTCDDILEPLNRKPLKANSKRKPWDICDDFLNPLAEMLKRASTEWFYNGISGERVSVDILHKDHPPTIDDFLVELERATKDRQFAHVWLQVNVSVELADYVNRIIDEAFDAVQGNSDLEIEKRMLYLSHLATVLKGRQKGGIEGDDIVRSEYRGPYRATDLYSSKRGRSLLNISRSVFYRRFNNDPEFQCYREGSRYFVHERHLGKK